MTGADGVKYTLSIPANALPLSEEISLTPVTEVTGLPLHGGLLGAVHIKPEGTLLIKPAVLTVEGVKPAPAGNSRMGFIYEGTGEEFHLFPASMKQTITFQLMHFSAPGVGAGSQQDLNGQLQRAPSTPLAQLEQDVAALLYAQPPVPDLAARAQALFDKFEKLLASEMDAALSPTSSVDQFLQAFDDLASFLNYAGSVGAATPQADALLLKWLAALPRVFKEQVNACFKHDVKAGLVALYLLKRAIFLGKKELPIDPVDRCLTFKLDFDTQQHSSAPQFGMSNHLTATGVPLSLLSNQRGSAPLVYAVYDFKPTYPVPCPWKTGTSVSQPFMVAGFGGLDLKRQKDPKTGALKLEMTNNLIVDVLPGKASEFLTITCPPPLQSYTTTTTTYNNNWQHLHEDEHVVQKCKINTECVPDFYAIMGWSIQNGQRVFAQKSYQREKGFAQVKVNEETTFTLLHDPVGSGIP